MNTHTFTNLQTFLNSSMLPILGKSSPPIEKNGRKYVYIYIYIYVYAYIYMYIYSIISQGLILIKECSMGRVLNLPKTCNIIAR